MISRLPLSNMSQPTAIISGNIQDVVDVNLRSANARDGIRIMELSSLDNIVTSKKAEEIRKALLKNKVKVKQLTNQRAFQPWTKVEGFVEELMNVRFVPQEILPINAEVLIFDDTVAIYQVVPEVSVTIIENPAFAAQQKALFDNFWEVATPSALNNDGSTTIAVTINRAPEEVFEFIADLGNWPKFSDFAARFEKVTDDEYIAHTNQGDIKVKAVFDRDRLLLDHQCVMPDGSVDTIPYRVVPNKSGSELIMTNFRPKNATRAEYDEQLGWMEAELKKAKAILENN